MLAIQLMRVQAFVALFGAALFASACSGSDDAAQQAEERAQSDASLDSVEKGADDRPEDFANGSQDDIDGFPMFEGEFDEWLSAQVDCLRGAGWDAEFASSGDGVSVPNLTFEDRDVFYEARDACHAEIGVLPPPEPLTEEEIREVYAMAVEAKRCLEDEGYEIDDPPSADRFVESWDSGPWTPYGSIGRQVPQAEWERLNEVCPQPARE